MRLQLRKYVAQRVGIDAGKPVYACACGTDYSHEYQGTYVAPTYDGYDGYYALDPHARRNSPVVGSYNGKKLVVFGDSERLGWKVRVLSPSSFGFAAAWVGSSGGKRIMAIAPCRNCVNTCICNSFNCPQMAPEWTLRVHGFANHVLAACPTCGDFNGEHRLYYQGDCTWQTETTGPCSANPRWQVSKVAGSWEAVNAAGTLYRYSDYHCVRPITLTKINDGGCASPFGTLAPSSVHLRPMGFCAITSRSINTGICSTCEAIPAQWQVTVSGLTNSTCSNCALFNGTHVLDYDYACVWKKTLSGSAGCPPVNPNWNSPAIIELTADVNLNYELRFGADNGTIAGATYRKPVCAWNCLGTNTMTLVSSSGCDNWPGAVSVSPA